MLSSPSPQEYRIHQRPPDVNLPASPMPPAPICVVMSETPILLPVTGAKGLKGIVFASRGRDYSCVTAKGKSDWFNSRMVG